MKAPSTTSYTYKWTAVLICVGIAAFAFFLKGPRRQPPVTPGPPNKASVSMRTPAGNQQGGQGGGAFPSRETPSGTASRKIAGVGEFVSKQTHTLPYPIVEKKWMSPAIEPFDPLASVSLAIRLPDKSLRVTYDVVVESTGKRGRKRVDVGILELRASQGEGGFTSVTQTMSYRYSTVQGEFRNEPTGMAHSFRFEVDATFRRRNVLPPEKRNADYLRRLSCRHWPSPDFMRELHVRLPYFPKEAGKCVGKGDVWRAYDDPPGLYWNVVYELEGFALVDGVETAVVKATVVKDVAAFLARYLSERVYVSLKDGFPIYGTQLQRQEFADGATLTFETVYRRRRVIRP